MSRSHSADVGAGDHQVAGADAVREHLATRTQQILEQPSAPDDPAAAERDKAVVRQCRYLMRLLSMRSRSAGEMRQRLSHREVPPAIIHEVMARMDRAGLVDDEAFAREWVQQRRALRALSDRALRRELDQREVAGEVIDLALESGDEEEEQRCRDLVRSRLGAEDCDRLRSERDGSHRRRLARRLDALLTRKGYPGDLAVRVIAAELRDAASSQN